MRDVASVNDLRQYAIEWNIRFPIDRWWREKHQVAFGSSIHRESCFIDQLIEYKEDEFWSEIHEERRIDAKLSQGKELEDGEIAPYKSGSGNWLKKREMDKNEIDKQFDDLSLDKIDL